MGDVIDFEERKRKKESAYKDWTPFAEEGRRVMGIGNIKQQDAYELALQKQLDRDGFYDQHFIPDYDW